MPAQKVKARFIEPMLLQPAGITIGQLNGVPAEVPHAASEGEFCHGTAED
jgi:hypothetical protein